MKFALLAAVAVIATPVMAQETPATAPTEQAAPSADQSTTMPQPADPAMQPAPADTGMAAAAPTDPNAADPAGGYAPTTTATTGPVQPGTAVTFRPAPSPSEAFPPPPPMAHYPICKKGQYDNCMQRGGR